jgi:glutamyl-tRNA synthetase
VFGLVPRAVGPDGRRLAKREGSIKLSSLRAAGVDPRRLIGWLAQSCGWAERAEPSTPHDWVGPFRLDTLPRQAWVVTPESVAGLVRGEEL